MKYVILEKDGHTEIRIGFTPQNHDELARPLQVKGYEVVSAGFAQFTEIGFATDGFSKTLGKGPQPGDAELLDLFYGATRRNA